MFPVFADRLAALLADLGHVFAVFADRFAALLADLRHMGPVLTDRLAALAGYFLLLVGIHCGKSPFVGLSRHDILLACGIPMSQYRNGWTGCPIRRRGG